MRVRLLGGLAVDGVDRRALGSRKARLFLARLAISPRLVVTSDRLVDCVWGDTPPSRPRADLSVLASRLRTVLGRERIEHDGVGYRLVVDWVDAEELAAAAAAVERLGGEPGAVLERVEAALALVRGRLLDDEPDAAWVQPARAAADRTVAQLRRAGARAALATSAVERAVAFAGAALDDDGFDEEALRLLMAAHVRAGRPGSALAAYAGVRARLSEELGVGPSPETEAGHDEALRATDDGPPPGPPSGDADAAVVAAPGARGAALVGRHIQLAALDEALAASRSGPEVVVVAGPAGIGKSALLQAWAARARAGGATVLEGAFDPLGRDLPLQAELDAVAAHLHAHPADAALVAESVVVLGPLLEVAGRRPDAATAAAEPAASADAGAGAGVNLVHHALADVLGRLSSGRPLALVLDDAHLAGPSTAAFLGHLRRRAVPVAVVTSVRGSGRTSAGDLPATRVVELGPLDRTEAADLVGPAEAARLHERSGGNPLFLLELAQAADGELPATLAAAVTARLPSDPVARAVFETAAVLGVPDVETVARVLGLGELVVAAHLTGPAAAGLIDERAGGLAFHHDLVREALVASLSAPRRALLHREAARALVASASDRVDPVAVAEHARLGGDVTLAATAYDRAADLVAARHDHDAALAYHDRAQELAPTAARLVARARAATLAGRFDEARRDVAAAVGDDPTGEAYEIGAWAAYFARDFADAASWADDGAALAAGPAIAARCLMIGGRIRHATGDLAPAERLLEQALARTEGHDHAIAAAWLGCLRAHQSRPADALPLLRAAARAAGPTDSAAHLHALLFTGHALALSGRPADALLVFERHEEEAERRHAVRFLGRGRNCRAWVLRHLGDEAAALDENARAAEHAATLAAPGETAVAAALDLAEGALLAADPDAARRHLARADALWQPDLVFAWRLDLKRRLHRARLARAEERWSDAAEAAAALAARAEAIGMPRYAAAAELVRHEARHRAGEPVDRGAVARDLARLRDEPEAWWAWARAAAVFGVPAWRQTADQRVAALAPLAGDRAETLWRTADRAT